MTFVEIKTDTEIKYPEVLHFKKENLKRGSEQKEVGTKNWMLRKLALFTGLGNLTHT